MTRRMSAPDRWECILQGAMEVFPRKGLRGVTTREIAQRLGISEARIFNYFPSKEALYRAIIQKKTDGSKEMLFPKEAIQAKDDRQVFRSIASYLFSKNTDDPTFMRLIHDSAPEGHELSEIFFETHSMEKTKFLSKDVCQRIKEQAFQNFPPLLAARAFIGMIIYYVQSQELYGMKSHFNFSQKRAVDTFVEIFLNGLTGSSRRNGTPKRKSRS